MPVARQRTIAGSLDHSRDLVVSQNGNDSHAPTPTESHAIASPEPVRVANESGLLRPFVLNLIGRGVSVGSKFLLAPLTIALFGLEKYALLSVWQTLIGISSLLELGVGMAVIDSVARASARSHGFDEDTAAFLVLAEKYYWMAAAAFGLLSGTFLFFYLPPWVPKWHYMVVAAAAASTFPASFYLSFLIARREFLRLNVYTALTAILQISIASLVGALTHVEVSMFAGLFAAGCLSSLLGRLLCSGQLPERPQTPVSSKKIHHNLKFTIQALIVQALAVIFAQGDRLLLARVLNVHDFSVVTLGLSMGFVGSATVYPLYQVLYPSLIRHRALKTAAAGMQRLRAGAAFLGVAALTGVLGVVILFEKPIVTKLLRVSTMSSSEYYALSLLIIAGGLTALRMLPFAALAASQRFTALTIVHAILIGIYFASLIVFGHDPTQVARICCGISVLSLITLFLISSWKRQPADHADLAAVGQF